jgi:hypothetical protein
MKISDLYPYWKREREMLYDGLTKIVDALREKRTPEQVEGVFKWIPGGGVRSISGTLRHMAYVEYYITCLAHSFLKKIIRLTTML